MSQTPVLTLPDFSLPLWLKQMPVMRAYEQCCYNKSIQ
jgi:hypothetical protein